MSLIRTGAGLGCGNLRLRVEGGVVFQIVTSRMFKYINGAKN